MAHFADKERFKAFGWNWSLGLGFGARNIAPRASWEATFRPVELQSRLRDLARGRGHPERGPGDLRHLAEHAVVLRGHRGGLRDGSFRGFSSERSPVPADFQVFSGVFRALKPENGLEVAYAQACIQADDDRPVAGSWI